MFIYWLSHYMFCCKRLLSLKMLLFFTKTKKEINGVCSNFYLISNWKRSANQIISRMPLHCITSSTEDAKVLSKLGHHVSCNYIGLPGDHWEILRFTKKEIFGGPTEKYSTHFHHSDINWYQKIMIGFGTTQHINTGHNDSIGNYAPHQLSNISAIDLKKTFMDWENG